MQGKVSYLPKASTSFSRGFEGVIYGQSYFLGYNRKQLIRNVLLFAHESEDNPITLGSALFIFNPLMRSVLLQPCQSCLELISKPGEGLITNNTGSSEMSNIKTPDKHLNSAKHLRTQDQASTDLTHALGVKDVLKSFVAHIVNGEYHTTQTTP